MDFKRKTQFVILGFKQKANLKNFADFAINFSAAAMAAAADDFNM
jgi:hypothetical protein